MAPNVFSVPIFFIVFRETLEAAIIVSVLLGLVEQIVEGSPTASSGTVTRVSSHEKDSQPDNPIPADEAKPVDKRMLIRKLRLQIMFGALGGFLLAFVIGAAFIAVWFTEAADLWTKTEYLWEGIFYVIAAVMIFVMGITMLKMESAKIKWRIKLQKAFDTSTHTRGGRSGKWVLFILPFVTVLREGMEAVIFVGGVSLGQSATSIPLATVCGLICGLICGFLIYFYASRATLRIFLVTMTNFLLLIGAGLFSKAVASFQTNAFNNLVGSDVDDTAGTGPGSYDVRGNVWHLNCCTPEAENGGEGYAIFGALFGWDNNASIGTILSYVFYWLAVIVALVYLKWKEGRVKLLGKESGLGARRRIAREQQSAAAAGEKTLSGSSEGVVELPR